MNSYTDNLHATVVNALEMQNLEVKNLVAKANASLFSLYHDQGATITAGQKLVSAKAGLVFRQAVSNQAVTVSNIANNQLASATQANQYVKQSVTNAAVCAANVQVAANAIVRLAGDIGSIFSIINAADYGTQLYTYATQLKQLINDTAYAAEQASQNAMQASMLTSEVSSATVWDKSKSTNAQANNLLKLCSADAGAAMQTVLNAQSTLAAASAAEALAGGAHLDSTTDVQAAQTALGFATVNLNNSLSVSDVDESSFTVNFEQIQAPFKKPLTDIDPVSSYYFILVKDSQKVTFSITDAENLLAQKSDHIIINIPVGAKSHVSQRFNYRKMPSATSTSKTFVLHDADGEPITAGTNYVVFLMAVYTDAYKKSINNFDNFLSAASNTFNINPQFAAVAADSINVIKVKASAEKQAGNVLQLEFRAAQNATSKPEHRCLFLPVSTVLMHHNKAGFVFDAMIAEQVPAANYTVAVADGKGQYTATISESTTDNFGNPLLTGSEYIPAVLTIDADEDQNYRSALSNINTTKTFSI
ncbi:MAG: hypothetical protein ABIN91_06940 [Mucilaginibacter sp.]|uniref:hypothetical protein n=1 Tax=Mucilaginibacter sp. TaxID=1882438 RepID=UPI0032640EDD